MSHATHYETAPEDRIPFIQKAIYGLGAFVNNLLASSGNLVVPVLNIGLGMNPVLAGMLGSLPRLTDAITDPLMGYISDNTRSRWGRRRPYIFVGAITAGLLLMLLWQLPDGKSESFYFWYFLIVSFVFFLAYTVYATPWVALGYELTPDYHERTRLMGVQNFLGTTVWMIAGYYIAFTQTWFDSMREGAAALAIIMGIAVIGIGILPAIFLRERFREVALAEAAEHVKSGMAEAILGFLRGFVTTISFMPFLKLCLATFLIFNGFQLIASFQIYVLTYYVFEGSVPLGSLWYGHANLVGMLATLFLVIPFITWLGTKIGKRRALVTAIVISMIGYGSKWFLYTPDTPWLALIPAPLQAFGLGALFTITPSMIADVVDMDELKTHERREGMYGSIFWWVVKLGMSLALLLSGFLLNWTGFDVALEADQTEQAIILMRAADAFVPVITSAIALWAILSFPITEERAYEVRQELEKRRGTLDDPAPQPA